MDINSHRQLVILGSGPAGLSAAIYAARAELKPLLLSGLNLHGQAAQTYDIENYPGFPKGISGAELGQLFQEQAECFGTDILFDQATEVILKEHPFLIKTFNNAFTADSIIIATGADPRKLNIPGEKEFTGRGVSYCATCDGAFFKNKNVVVVGGGDSALEESLFLTRFASSVKIIHRRDKLRAGVILEKRANDNPKIKFIWNTIVSEIIGGETVDSVKCKNLISGREEIINTDGVFIFIGHVPNSDMFKDQVRFDKNNYIMVNGLMETSVPGVFAAGEVADPHFRQVITSAGMGAAAGITALHFIESLQ